MKGISIHDLPERYREQARRALANNKIPRTTANMEPDINHAPLPKKKAQGFDGQVDVSFSEKRHRLADPDGACVKYIIDSLVTCEVLRDDSAKEVGKVAKEQVKINKDEQEETIIEIWRA